MVKHIGLIMSSWAILLASCNNGAGNAQLQYDKAVRYFEAGEYPNAKSAIDSIEIIAPKAFDQIKAGMLLMCRVQQKEGERNLIYIDSMLTVRNAELQKAKEKFRLEKNEQYQTEGYYIYNKLPKQATISNSQLKVQVTESGQLQLSSIYYGKSPLKHTSIRATLLDKSEAETLTIGYDGANNYRFTNLGQNTEIVTYKDGQCAALVSLIANSPDSNIKVTYLGGNRYTLRLTPLTQEAIRESRDLANLIKNIDTLQREYEHSIRTIELADRQIAQLEAQQEKK